MLINCAERGDAGCSQERSGVEKIMYTVPRYCTLDGASAISAKLEGVTLRTLEPCDTIHARTYNHDYEIFLLDPESGRALVRGGKYFVEPTEATVSGSTFGGCMLKLGWLGVGMHMEIHAAGQCLVTTPVESLRVEKVCAEPENMGWDQSGAVDEAGSLKQESAAADLVQAAGA